MKLRTVFIANTIVAIIYALGAFLMPKEILELHGFGTDTSTIWMGRFFAVELLGIGLVTWFARDSEESSARGSIVLGLMLHDVVGAVVAVLATLEGAMDSTMGWLPVALYVLLGLGYASVYFKK
jgi:hypothetical protein